MGALFCLVFALFGLAVAALIGHEVWLEVQPHFWKTTECRIVRSEAAEKQPGRGAPFVVNVRYAYAWEKQPYTSDRFYRRVQTFSDLREAQRLIDPYPADGWAVCLVNPVRPSEAVLLTRFPWLAFALAIPLLFVALGAVGFYAAVRSPGAGDKSVPEAAGPASSRGDPGAMSGCLFIFFLLFFALGVWVFYLLFLRPMLQSRQAQSWPEVPCVILASEVQRLQGDSGSTYSVDILYEYEIEGRSHRASRHSFVAGSSSGRADKEAVVRRFPPGRRTVCYVNPADPTEAVLERGVPGGLWMAVIPGAFMTAGAFGMVYASRRRSGGGRRMTVVEAGSESGSGGDDPRPREESGDDSERGPLVFHSASGRVGKLLGFFFFGAFWNGVTSVFVWPFLQGTKRLSSDWGLAVFMIPFVLIGLFLCGLVGYYFLALLAPRARLTVARRNLRIGESFDLEWSLVGRVERIEVLRIYLEGREEATYRRGTNTTTDRHVFAEVEIATVSDRVEMRAGRARVSIPNGVVPSFASRNNKIVWNLRLKGDIRMFPDIDDEFALKIGPKAGGRLSRKGTA